LFSDPKKIVENVVVNAIQKHHSDPTFQFSEGSVIHTCVDIEMYPEFEEYHGLNLNRDNYVQEWTTQVVWPTITMPIKYMPSVYIYTDNANYINADRDIGFYSHNGYLGEVRVLVLIAKLNFGCFISLK
jgi:hypothetical protein